MFTQHSVTTEFDQAGQQIAPSLRALERLGAEGVQVIGTYPNNDAGGRRIIAVLNAWMERKPVNVQIASIARPLALSRRAWHSRDCQRPASCVPAIRRPGSRKRRPSAARPSISVLARLARLRADNVIDADYNAEEIEAAMRRALYDEPFRALCRTANNPYGIGDAGKKIANVLAAVDLSPALLRKGMTLRGEARTAGSDE